MKGARPFLPRGNRSHSLAADRLLQGFNRGQIAPKCVFPTDYALKPEKGCWLSGGKVNNYIETNRRSPSVSSSSRLKARGSKRTSSASENRIWCFRKFVFAFFGSHTMFIFMNIHILYVQRNLSKGTFCENWGPQRSLRPLWPMCSLRPSIRF